MDPMPVSPFSDADVFDCIQKGDVDQCVLFVQNDRSVLRHRGNLTLRQLLHEMVTQIQEDRSCDNIAQISHTVARAGNPNPNSKGWGGFTPLHYAALHGNRILVDLFLSNGADPNMTCDAGQTAFHFACRQGNIFIIHQMLQYGADLRLVDVQGKTALHHAVTGGSIISVHYLWETGMFRFSDTDMYQVTPLHLAASTGNTEVVRYLLRDQRCSVDAADQQGATALHVAAERGGVEVCWMLLQRTGCRMLHLRNHCGQTPLDLCKQGRTFRHQQLSKLLRMQMNEPLHHKPTESIVLYYWTLLFPSLSGAVILLIAHMLGGYGGLICSLLFPWLARSIFTQFHRMTTYQRLPNPVYLGTLLAGLTHTLLCFFGRITPSVWPNSALFQMSIMHFALVLCLFCKVLTQDPGTLDRADADPRFSCIADLVESNQSPHMFCPYCELFLPDHTKHCKLCEVCIKDYDHHCLFLNRCIGQGNHRLFLFFILSMVMAHLFFVASATSYLYDKVPPGFHSLSLWLALLGEEFWVVVMIVMNLLTLFWEAWLLTEQFDAIATGTTTYFRHCESSARLRSPRQRWVIVLSFLIEGRRRVGSGQMREDKTAIDI